MARAAFHAEFQHAQVDCAIPSVDLVFACLLSKTAPLTVIITVEFVNYFVHLLTPLKKLMLFANVLFSLALHAEFQHR